MFSEEIERIANSWSVSSATATIIAASIAAIVSIIDLFSSHYHEKKIEKMIVKTETLQNFLKTLGMLYSDRRILLQRDFVGKMYGEGVATCCFLSQYKKEIVTQLLNSVQQVYNSSIGHMCQWDDNQVIMHLNNNPNFATWSKEELNKQIKETREYFIKNYLDSKAVTTDLFAKQINYVINILYDSIK